MSLVYWSAFSLYFRTLTYFSAANPKIYLGGMLDERKSDIYDHIPSRYMPLTRLYKSFSEKDIAEVIQVFSFPIVMKPNVGYKGFLVKRIDRESELLHALEDYKDREVIIQEFVDEACEYAVMYYYVDDHQYGVTSLVEKTLPILIGDGKKTIRTLIEELDNPFLNVNWILKKNKAVLENILPDSEQYVIDHVGNYSRGSKFYDLNHEICPDLIQAVHAFYRNINGMNFCRMDVKAHSIEDLKNGNFKLLEINGAKSEPLHIYDPNIGFVQILKSIHKHWIILFKVVKRNIKIVDFPSSIEGIKSYYSLKKMVS